MALLPPIANTPFVDSRGYLTTAAVQALQTMANQAAGVDITTATRANVPAARNDQDASVNHGVPRFGLYHNGSALQIQKDFP